jgi:hypothetical protein
MNEINILLQAIETLRADLPAHIGVDWTDFESRLNGYLTQMKQNPASAPIVRAQILALFGRHHAAHQQLIECMGELQGQDAAAAPVTRGAGNVAKSISEPTEPRQVTRYTDISCPRRIWVDAPRVSVVVRLTIRSPQYSAAVGEMVLREDLPVQARIVAPLFENLNAPVQTIAILPDHDSEPIVFDLRPRAVGPTKITIDFLQRGEPVGTATVAVDVTAYQVSEESEPHPVRPLRIEPDVAPPDMVLHIGWDERTSSLEFTLIQDGGAWMHTYPAMRINGDPATHTAELYRQITSLVGMDDPTAEAVLQQQRQIPYADVDRRVKRLGQNLWRGLIPQELKTLYGREREQWRNRTLLIFSDEPFIPWELVWAYEAGAWEDEGPWCHRLRLTRWLRKDEQGNGNEKAPGRLRLHSLAVLAPTYSLLKDLPYAQYERQAILDMMRQHHLQDVSPGEPTWQAVMDLLEAGGYDWLHMASHGNFYPEAPDGDAALWLQKDNALTPQHIAGMAIEGYLRAHHPVFFFNACEVGRQGWALTRIGGWANRLISCGAGLFVGPLWSVKDNSALTFANTFYQALLEGDTVATATQAARTATRQIGDPTWLAYSVYGHPNAQVVLNHS